MEVNDQKKPKRLEWLKLKYVHSVRFLGFLTLSAGMIMSNNNACFYGILIFAVSFQFSAMKWEAEWEEKEAEQSGPKKS